LQPIVIRDDDAHSQIQLLRTESRQGKRSDGVARTAQFHIALASDGTRRAVSARYARQRSFDTRYQQVRIRERRR
jgi:hypothetical protein